MCLHYLGKFEVSDWAFWLSIRCNNKVYTWMINWIVTNTTGSYTVSKSNRCHITSSLLQHVLKMSASSTNASASKTLRHSPTAHSMIAWRTAAHSRLMRRFSSLTFEILHDRLTCNTQSTRCSQPGDSRFSMILWLNNILSWRMRYQYAFTVVNGQNTTSAFHKVV